MEQEIVLALDFDDTLIEFEKAWQAWHREIYGDQPILPWSHPEGIKRGHEFIRSAHHREIPAVDGAVDAVGVLERKRKLVINTARDKAQSDCAVHLMELRFPKAFKHVHFLHENLQKLYENKGEVCRVHGIDEHLDDGLLHAIAVRDAGVRSYLFTTPQNLGQEASGVIRVNNWNHFLEFIE